MTAIRKVLQQFLQEEEESLQVLNGRKESQMKMLETTEEQIRWSEDLIADLEINLVKWFPEAGGSDGPEDKEKEELQT